jgi:hypothetical protein
MSGFTRFLFGFILAAVFCTAVPGFVFFVIADYGFEGTDRKEGTFFTA